MGRLIFISVNYVCSAGESKGLVWSKQLVGSNDDILDILTIPQSVHTETDSNTVSYKVAIVSNSVLIQIVDENMVAQPLAGHSDVVLAVDASPDGYCLFKEHFACIITRNVQEINCYFF
jgi:hypothetical protein